ncbi:MAG TPA: hypothetical protein VLM76_15165 [Patescibacteria group bacterium]|nr:hypothetical protein [Patescibacteria group bacterium]
MTDVTYPDPNLPVTMPAQEFEQRIHEALHPGSCECDAMNERVLVVLRGWTLVRTIDLTKLDDAARRLR